MQRADKEPNSREALYKARFRHLVRADRILHGKEGVRVRQRATQNSLQIERSATARSGPSNRQKNPSPALSSSVTAIPAELAPNVSVVTFEDVAPGAVSRARLRVRSSPRDL